MKKNASADLSAWRGWRRALTALLAAAVLCPAACPAGLSAFAEDFETLNPLDPGALGGKGWVVYGNVFSADFKDHLYGYGVFPAPNGTPGFCSVSTGQGGPPQGAQGLVVYSDYNNGDQANGNQVEANVYQERALTAGDAGEYVFRFDAKAGDLVPPSLAWAFIKTIDPATGYSTTSFLKFDTVALPVTWGTYSIGITVTPAMAGQLLQFGFAATATGYKASGVFYDNVSFGLANPPPVVPPVITGLAKTGSSVAVTFQTQSGALYDLLKSADGLADFQPVSGQQGIEGTGAPVVATDAEATEANAFYRIRRQP